MSTPYLEENEVLFSVICDEPEGSVERFVRPLLFTPENLQKFWLKAKEFPTLMDKNLNTFEHFLNIFIKDHGNGILESKGLCAQVDDLLGVFWITNIDWPRQASIHYSFFDRRHKGRVNLGKAAIKYVFDKYKFHRIYTHVPLYSKSALRFVESIGFVKEGRLRSNTFFRDEWYDSNVYSILETEV